MQQRTYWGWAGIASVAIVVASLLPRMAAADTVQLANGDTLSGEVLSLDGKQLRIKSPILGEMNIARAQVQAIFLGDAKAPVAASAAAKPAEGAGPLTVERILKQLGAGAGGKEPVGVGDDLLKQLQGGVPPAELDKLKKQFPLLGSPEVQGYFNKTVGGLLDGSLSLNDIRKEAIRARDETRDAIKDLGPEAEKALSGYLGILDQFIKETEPKPIPPAAPKKPQP